MTKRQSLSAFTVRKDVPATSTSSTDRAPDEVAEAPRRIEDPRQRVVLRLHIDAVEALEDIARERRRSGGRAVPIQSLLEEAVADFFSKNGMVVEVKPAPAKQKR